MDEGGEGGGRRRKEEEVGMEAEGRGDWDKKGVIEWRKERKGRMLERRGRDGRFKVD